MTAAPEIQTLNVDGIAVSYVLLDRQADLLPHQWEKIKGKDKFIVHCRYRIDAREYYFEMMLPKEMQADVNFTEKFLPAVLSSEIKNRPRTDTKLIRFDCQSAYHAGVSVNQPKAYVEALGMNVIKCVYSSYGACFFMEVQSYIEDPKKVYVLLKTAPKDFNWNA